MLYDEAKLGRFHHVVEINENLKTSDLTAPYGEKHGFSNHSRLAQEIKNIYKDELIHKTALSVACNAGGQLFYLQKHGIRSGYGFDVRKIWIDQANWLKENITSYRVDNLCFFQHDIEGMSENENFDITFFDGIFYHLSNPYMALAKMAKITKEIITVDTRYEQSTETRPVLFLKFESDKLEDGLSGIQRVSWSPNGEEVVKNLLKHLGFKSFKLFSKTEKRFCLIASRNKNQLK